MKTEMELEIEQSKQKVVGKAIYFELEQKLEIKNKIYTSVKQMIFFPEFILDGVYSPIHRAERTLTINHKRPRWSMYATSVLGDEFSTDGRGEYQMEKMDIDKATAFASKRVEKYLLPSLVRYLESISDFVKNTIVIEMSEYDAKEILAGRVPADAIKRVVRARKAVGFPDLDRVNTVINRSTS